MEFVETITDGETTLAIIVRGSIDKPGISFFTPGDFSQQLAYMQHPAEKTIVAHVHKPVHRALTKTLEVLMLRKGRLRVDLYNEASVYIVSHILSAGDIILLVAGGHGFKTLDAVEMFEVKQGPYAGDDDKVRIPGVDSSDIRIAEANS